MANELLAGKRIWVADITEKEIGLNKPFLLTPNTPTELLSRKQNNKTLHVVRIDNIGSYANLPNCKNSTVVSEILKHAQHSDAVKSTSTCEHCGVGQTEKGDRFCTYCGGKHTKQEKLKDAKKLDTDPEQAKAAEYFATVEIHRLTEQEEAKCHIDTLSVKDRLKQEPEQVYRRETNAMEIADGKYISKYANGDIQSLKQCKEGLLTKEESVNRSTDGSTSITQKLFKKIRPKDINDFNTDVFRETEFSPNGTLLKIEEKGDDYLRRRIFDEKGDGTINGSSYWRSKEYNEDGSLKKIVVAIIIENDFEKEKTIYIYKTFKEDENETTAVERTFYWGSHPQTTHPQKVVSIESALAIDVVIKCPKATEWL